MKKTSILIAMTILLFAAFTIVANAEPGTEIDPAVTKSYVDGRISEIMRVLDNTAPSSTTGEAAGFTFVPVSVPQGQTIYAGEGTEIIMRSGNGTIVTTTDGVTNVTMGTDMGNGAVVKTNQLLIFPRDDGRGIKVTNSAWFIVKGAYTVR